MKFRPALFAILTSIILSAASTTAQEGAAAPIDLTKLPLAGLITKADGGDLEACREVARRHFSGEGVEANPTKGSFYLRQAAEGGHAIAQFEFAVATEKAAPENTDHKDVVHWLEQSGTNGYGPALRKLSNYTTAGRGVPADPARATALMAQAAQRGDIVAMNEMGVRYQQGIGIAKDPVAAIGWFSLAAQNQLPAALINLGNAYENGLGCLQNFDLAGQHYAAAAKQNHPTAQALIARMFEEGKGTQKNPVFAYVNYQRAGQGGVAEAKKKAESIFATLSDAQKKEAETHLQPAAPVAE